MSALRKRYEDAVAPARQFAASMPSWSRWLLVALIILVAIFIPFTQPQANTFMNASTQALAYVVMALGLNIVVGFAGLLDLGYVAFYAFGAYSIGWFASSWFAKANVHLLVQGPLHALPGIHLNFLIVCVIAMIIASIAGVLIGLPTLRLRGDYIAIVTLGFGEIIRVWAINGDSIKIKGMPLTNGAQGITPIDQIKLPWADPFNQLNLRPWYWLGLAFALIILFCNVRLRDSRLGRAWIAVREDEVAAVSMGIPLVKTKLLAYASGAACGGLGGAYLGALTNTVAGTSFQFSFSIFVLAMIILGGLGSIWGATIGAVVLSFINYYAIQKLSVPGFLHLNLQLADVAIGIFGFLLVFIMVIRPEGLLPERRRKLELTEGLASDQSFEVSA